MNKEELFLWNTSGMMGVLCQVTLSNTCRRCDITPIAISVSYDKYVEPMYYCTKHNIEFHTLCSNPLENPKAHHMKIYAAIIVLGLSNQTIFKIGLVLFPHVRFSSCGEMLSFERRIRRPTTIKGARRMVRICQDVNTRAKAAIVVLWQLPMIHKDVRLMIANWLWRDRIKWLNKNEQ
jgi:hypothetical protein